MHLSYQNKEQELAHAKKILHNPEFYWNSGTVAGERASLRRARWIARAADFGPGKRILEVGCGTGFFSKIFLEYGVHLHSIDLSPELIQKAKERCGSEADFRVADIENIPYEDETFDAVVGVRVLHHLEMESSFREIFRVLKKGGSIAFCEPNMLNPQIMIQKNIPFIKRLMGDTPDETAFLKWQLRKFLSERGFEHILIEPFDFLHPWTPKPLVSYIEKFGFFLERVPLIREIGGSLQIFAKKGAKKSHSERSEEPPPVILSFAERGEGSLSIYPFKNKYLRLFVSVIDSIGRRFFPRNKIPCPNFKTILIIRLDQIGDIVLSQPFITALKKKKPDTRIIFLTTPAGHEILGQLPDIDEFVIFQPGWFALSSRDPFVLSSRDPFALSSRDPQGRGISYVQSFINQIRTFFSLVRCLKQVPADVIVDPRGDFRHILAARIAKPESWILSYGNTGGGFLLDCEARHSAEPAGPRPEGRRIPSHAVMRNMHLLNYLFRHPEPKAKDLDFPILSPKICSSPLSFLLRKKESKWIVLHLGAATPSKLWPLSHWGDLLDQMTADQDIHFFIIGDEKADDLFQKLNLKLNRSSMTRITNLCGKLPLSQLGTFLKMCDLLISVDSAPVHIAAAHGVKTIVLFSGTTEPDIWKPLNTNAKMLAHPVSCAPCHEKICPKEKHFCMEDLNPQKVYSEVQAILS